MVEQTAENVENLQRAIGDAEDQRQKTNQALNALTDSLSSLGDHLHGDQAMMRTIMETQRDLAPVMSRIANAMEDGTLGIDEATRHHIRNMDGYLTRLADDLPQARDHTIRELRGEIRQLTRTIAALAEDQEG
jgi:chromosome segregation ATPase